MYIILFVNKNMYLHLHVSVPCPLHLDVRSTIAEDGGSTRTSRPAEIAFYSQWAEGEQERPVLPAEDCAFSGWGIPGARYPAYI